MLILEFVYRILLDSMIYNVGIQALDWHRRFQSTCLAYTACYTNNAQVEEEEAAEEKKRKKLEFHQ